jgi:hypothetical protein
MSVLLCTHAASETTAAGTNPTVALPWPAANRSRSSPSVTAPIAPTLRKSGNGQEILQHVGNDLV